MSITLAAGCPIDLPRLLETRLLVQANSGGGKSWALRRLLEQTANKVQQIVIDPEGEFATLREKFDYIVCAAHDGDAVAHPRTAKLLARRLLETGVSAILDIYDLSAYDRRSFVRQFVDALVDAPKALWHPTLIVLDEAHVYAPEHGSAESSQAVIDLATRGRKRGFCLVTATQRLSKLHKDVAAEMNNKMIGRTGLDVDVKRAADELGMTKADATAALRNLDDGEWFVYGPALSKSVEKIKVGPVVTTHPKAGQRLLVAPPEPSAKVRAALAELADLPQQAADEARTLEDFKRQLAETTRKLRAAEKLQPAAPPAAKVDVRPYQKTIERLRAAVETLMKFVIEINTKDFAAKVGVDEPAMTAAIQGALAQVTTLIEAKLETRNREVIALQKEGRRLIDRIKKLTETDDVTLAVSVTQNEPFTIAPRAPRPPRAVRPSNGHDMEGSPLGKGERACLIAIAQNADGVDREQITILTGYKRSTRDAYVARLQTAGFVDIGPPIVVTEAGLAALPSDFEPLPTGEALRAHWLERLPQGERAVFQMLVEAYPQAVSRDEITNATEYKRSTRDAYIARLSTRKLVVARAGAIVASETLFA